MTSERNLTQIYENRFSGHENYRKRVWKILTHKFFSKWIKSTDHILDLGCGYGEFINHTKCEVRHAMDLNPKTKSLLDKEIIFHQQDCSKTWKIEPNSLDLVFTSNFFEHLPKKECLDRTICEVKKALKPGGRLIAMGPNISVLKGKYWDFWDHHVALSDQSLCELLQIHDFTIEQSYSKFMPYNMVRIKERPLFLVSLYLKFTFLWKLLGKQFLIIAKK
jgi:dolichol-phosphate mannosyltransferase